MRIKIGILFALIFLFFFAGAVWFIYASVKGILVENENQRLTARALLIAEKTDIAPIVLPLPEAHERFAVWYDNGSTLQELFRSPGLEIEKFSTSATIQEGDKHRIAWITNDRNEIGGKIIVAIEFTESSLNSNVQRLLILLIITLIVSIFISFGMAYYASGVLLQPIRDIITTAKTINSANLTHPITVAATNDELEELGKTINDMLLRIENGLQMQNNFFASASHELRTPLSVLQAQFEVEILNPEVNEYSKSILRSQLQEVKRLNRLVEDFLTLSQIRANMVQLRREAVELDDLVISIVERCRVLMEQSRVYLKLDLQEYESFRVHADKDKLIHVIINLTENAIKYSVPHSTIHVHLEKASSEIVRITIANQTQRPLTNLEELKQEFYRADVFQQGYGLGLWISNKILEAHNYRLLLSQHENTFVSTIECKTITENN